MRLKVGRNFSAMIATPNIFAVPVVAAAIAHWNSFSTQSFRSRTPCWIPFQGYRIVVNMTWMPHRWSPKVLSFFLVVGVSRCDALIRFANCGASGQIYALPAEPCQFSSKTSAEEGISAKIPCHAPICAWFYRINYVPIWVAPQRSNRKFWWL